MQIALSRHCLLVLGSSYISWKFLSACSAWTNITDFFTSNSLTLSRGGWACLAAGSWLSSKPPQEEVSWPFIVKDSLLCLPVPGILEDCEATHGGPGEHSTFFCLLWLDACPERESWLLLLSSNTGDISNSINHYLLFLVPSHSSS